jgi:Holliday junction resolvase RusA-like endonuclease
MTVAPLSLILPMPPSMNRIWAPVRTRGGARIVKRAEYAAWKKNAAREVDAQRNGRKITTPFRAHIILPRSGRDSDNSTKPLLDACQAGRAIANDKLCEGGSWDFDDTREGTALVIISPI